jgi:hypothetical protein
MVVRMKTTDPVPHWFMDEVEELTQKAKTRARPFGAFYTPDKDQPARLVGMSQVDPEAATSPRFMGMFDPASSGMEHALTMCLIHQFKREKRTNPKR